MSNKNILIINGHPYKESYNHALSLAYKNAAVSSGTVCKDIFIHQLKFQHALEFGYNQRINLEPDLLEAWEKITWADHIVIVYPIWWGGMPGVMKSFFDRLFLPGMAFQYRENSVFWDKLLSGKTGHIIATMDSPSWYFKWVYHSHSIRQLKKNILEFCGISPVKVTLITSMRKSSVTYRQNWLKEIGKMGKENK